MCLTVIKMVFCIIAVLMAILFSMRVFSNKNFVKQSAFVALIGGTFIFYVLSGFALSLILPKLLYKLIMIAFALSPFVIGKLVTYEKLKFYSIVQILCVILSIAFVIYI